MLTRTKYEEKESWSLESGGVSDCFSKGDANNIDFVWFHCRKLRVVDGNNRCYILCHPTLMAEVGGGNIEDREVNVKILREDTPQSVLLAISAGG